MPSATRDALQAAMKASLIQGNKERLGVVRMLITEVRNAEINDAKLPGRERTEEEVIALVATYHKNLAKSLAEFPEDRREPIRQEMKLVEEFLPRQLSADEIRAEIETLLRETPERTFGALMKVVSPRFAGRAEGRLVADTLKTSLAAAPTPTAGS